MKYIFKPLEVVDYFDAEGTMPTIWARTIVSRPSHVYEVPTEAVLFPNSKPVSLMQGRIWHAPVECGRDEKPGWSSCRYIIEMMDDVGDDGHVEYQCIGWALVTSTMLEEFLAAARACTDRYEFPRWDFDRLTEHDTAYANHWSFRESE